MNNITENQHYVPKSYQKYWSINRNGYIWELDKQSYEIRKTTTNSSCSLNYLYEADKTHPDNIFEKKYSHFEQKCGNIYRRLFNARNCLIKISDYDKEMICKIFANFSARHPFNLYGNLNNTILASYFRIETEPKYISIRILQNLIAIMNIMPMENNQLRKSEFEKQLLSSNLQILVTSEPKICFCNSLIEQIGTETEWFFPLNPYMLAYFSTNATAENKTIRKITESEYKTYIRLYAFHPLVRYIYATDASILEQIKTDAYFQLALYRICNKGADNHAKS